MSDSVSAWTVILAAGSGQRLGFDRPKGFVQLGGRPMLAWSVEAAAASGSGIVLVVPPGMLDQARPLVTPDVTVIEGGADRQASARLGLAAAPSDASVLVVHDAARPLVPPELFDRVAAAVASGSAAGAVPVVPSPDTVKRIRDGRVVETVPRDDVRLAQTPQAFVSSVLREVHERAVRDGLAATDDAMLLEAYGHVVGVVEGSASNFKITTPEDLDQAERILAGAPSHPVGGARG
ncbi:MAG TPA: 2-C-methyl-D-erythritol 4-phosphate cytidylyltransferase [Actinomycetota bacterium]|nr:2-C-methyl-D-erythritol 4-phosphate cytidylyltransferase [Actinomycetota bacterium]